MWSVSPTRFPPGSDRISFKRQELERIMPSHVFIVGGMSGIGLAVAAKLKGRGYAVTIAERDPAMPEAAHRSLGDVVAAATPPIRPWSRRRSPAPSRSIILFSPFGSGKGQGRLAASRSKPYGGVLRRKRCRASPGARGASPTLRRDGGLTVIYAAMPGTVGLVPRR
jgi:glycine/D-amino acid oxidase-like deaminating enzyme